MSDDLTPIDTAAPVIDTALDGHPSEDEANQAVTDTTGEAPAEEAPAADAPVEPASDLAPVQDLAPQEEAPALPLDASQPSDVSPVAEEITAPADVIAQDAEAEAPAEQAPAADNAPAPMPEIGLTPEAALAGDAVKTEDSKAAGEGDKNDNASGHGGLKVAQGTDTSKDGDDGLGATHLGTDTPEKMISNPCDPVTGKPLAGAPKGTAPRYFQSGDVPPKSDVGHVVPGDGLELDGGQQGAQDWDGDEPSDDEIDDCGITEAADFGAIYAKLDSIDDIISDVRRALQNA